LEKMDHKIFLLSLIFLFSLFGTRTVLASKPSGGGVCQQNDTIVCDGHGTCVKNGTTDVYVCVCESGYADTNCNYTRKSKLAAFLFSFFLGAFGVDRFYLGYIALGIIKLLIANLQWVPYCLMCCAIPCCLAASAKSGDSELLINEGKFKNCFCCASMAACCWFTICILVAVGLSLAFTIWWLIDWIMILTDELDDSKGYSLAPW